MYVNQTTIKQALHHIFREQRLRPGNWISLARLQQEWSAIQLRRSDLSEALRALSDEHYITLQNWSGDWIVTIQRLQPVLQAHVLTGLLTLRQTSKRLPFGRSKFERRRRVVAQGKGSQGQAAG